MKVQKYTFLLIFILSQYGGFAQVRFTDEAAYYNRTPGYGTVCVAVADINADGLDDIVRISNNVLEIIYQRLNGSPYTYRRVSSVPPLIYSILAANFDNDKELEIIIGAASGVFYLQVDPVYSIQQIQTGYLPQSMSALDLNNDRRLDLFICNDIGQNQCLINNGDNSFRIENDRFEVLYSDNQSNRGNYGSVFTDVDNDGDQDLYITKCNPDAPAGHPSRINMLYLNDGNGYFKLAHDSLGVNTDDQSWAADFADYDLDGDMDLVVINHDTPNKIYRNDGTHFTDMSAVIPLGTTRSALEVKWADFNGDGRPDLLITGEEHALYLNEGDEKFTRQPNPFGLYDMLGFGLADFNRDGRTDVYATYGNSIYGSSSVPDRVFINTTEHKYPFYGLRVLDSLHHNAVGARVVLYSDTISYINDIRAGESYGITCSNLLTFRLPSGRVDSINISWPSGKKYTISHDRFPESKFLTPGYFMTYAEDHCQSPALLFDIVDGKTEFCDGDSAVAYIDGDGIYLFTNDSIPGDFRQTVYDDLYLGGYAYHGDCRTFSQLYHFDKDPDEAARLILDKQPAYCPGEQVQVTYEPAYQLLNWQDNSRDSVIIISDDATVFARLQGLCKEVNTDTFQLNFVDVALPQVFPDTVSKDSMALLTATGDSIWWYESLTNGIPFHTGDTLIIDPAIRSDTFYVRNVMESGVKNVHTGFPADSSMLTYGSSNLNGGLEFNALQDIILDSVTVITDTAGIRTIKVIDEFEVEIASRAVQIEKGVNVIYLGFELPARDKYFITTDFETNLTELGTYGPGFTRERNNVQFPYIIPKLLEITQSNLGTNYYFYFYDWKVSTRSHLCLSEPVAVHLIVKDPSGTVRGAIADFDCHIQQEEISLIAPYTGPATFSLTGLQGSSLFQTKSTYGKGFTYRYKTGHLPPGIYFATLQFKDQLYFKKLRVD